MAKITEFGITARHLKRVTIIGGLFGAFFFLIVLIISLRLPAHRSIAWMAGYSLCIGGLLPGAVFLCSVLRLRIEGDQIEHTLFGKWVLDKRDIADLEVIRLGGRLFPVVLSFRGGGTMRLVGIPLWDQQALVAFFREQVPGCTIEM